MFTFSLPRLCLVLLFFVAQSSATNSALEFPRIDISIKGQTYQLEFANTFELRAQGLMHREDMCKNCGMLFHFGKPKYAGMWMKNTLIPLDVAFVRADGKITDIKAMQPHDLSTTTSSEAVLFAWEMNQGWFANNAIQVGDSIVLRKK